MHHSSVEEHSVCRACSGLSNKYTQIKAVNEMEQVHDMVTAVRWNSHCMCFFSLRRHQMNCLHILRDGTDALSFPSTCYWLGETWRREKLKK